MALGGILSVGLGLASGIAGLFGKKKKRNYNFDFDLPSFYEDPYYKPTQDELFGLGSDLIKGDIPDYFAPIGEVGGSEFERIVDLVTRDATQSVEESAIARGAGRSGVVSGDVARAVSDQAANLRFKDFIRAMKGRQDFLTLGTGALEGVRSAGLTNQGQRNQFSLNRAQLDLKNKLDQTNIDIYEDELFRNQQSDLFGGAGDLIGTGLGMLGSADGGFSFDELLSKLFGGGK